MTDDIRDGTGSAGPEGIGAEDSAEDDTEGHGFLPDALGARQAIVRDRNAQLQREARDARMAKDAKERGRR